MFENDQPVKNQSFNDFQDDSKQSIPQESLTSNRKSHYPNLTELDPLIYRPTSLDYPLNINNNKNVEVS